MHQRQAVAVIGPGDPAAGLATSLITGVSKAVPLRTPPIKHMPVTV